MNVPEYPMGTPVAVRLSRNQRPREPVVVRLEDIINPSPISIIHDNTSMCMTRMSGIDTMS